MAAPNAPRLQSTQRRSPVPFDLSALSAKKIQARRVLCTCRATLQSTEPWPRHLHGSYQPAAPPLNAMYPPVHRDLSASSAWTLQACRVPIGRRAARKPARSRPRLRRPADDSAVERLPLDGRMKPTFLGNQNTGQSSFDSHAAPRPPRMPWLLRRGCGCKSSRSRNQPLQGFQNPAGPRPPQRCARNCMAKTSAS
jgi:hypothetical protein